MSIYPQLLETVKRFMTLRVKSDKEYAALLLNMMQQTEKQESADYISTVSKVRPHLIWIFNYCRFSC